MAELKINAIPNVDLVEMDNIREGAHCCGGVLTMIDDPPVAADVGKKRLNEAIKNGAEKILALCPCCEVQFRVAANKKKLPIEIADLANFACQSLGYDFPDPNPEVHRQWAVFEAMIALVSTNGFADLMGTMWPELIDAMPLKMGKMMRVTGKIPSMLKLMKPMFPILFPILLPKMMPKVMNNLMPHMTKDIVPLISQPMIDYLNKKNKR